MEDIISFFTSDPQVKKPGKLYYKQLLGRASKHGLSDEHLVQLSRVIAHNTHGTVTSRFLLQNMVPSHGVPGQVTITLLSALGKSAVPTTLKVLILKWMAAVFHLLAKDTDFRVMFRVLLLQLNTQETLEHAANLLIMLASEANATNYTFQWLNRVHKNNPRSVHVNYMVSVYQTFRPGFAPIVTTRQRLALFELSWVKHMQRLQDGLKRNIEHPFTTADIGFRSFTARTDMAEVARYLESQPFHMSDLLRNQGIDILFESQAHRNLEVQMSYWVLYTISNAFHHPAKQENRCTDLNLLVSIACRLQENFPVVENFLCRYLRFWDGEMYFSVVLSLVSRCSVSSAPAVFEHVLGNLHQVFFYGSLEQQCDILKCLSDLTQHWITKAAAEVTGTRGADMFVHGKPGASAVDLSVAIRALIDYVDNCCALFITFHTFPPADALLVMLDFYIMLLDMHKKHKVLISNIPKWCTVVACFSSGSLACVDRLCEFLLRCYNMALEVWGRVHDDFVSELKRCLAWVVGSLMQHDWDSSEEVPNFRHRVNHEALALAEPRDEAFALWRHPALCLHLANFTRQHGYARDQMKEDPAALEEFLQYLSGHQGSFLVQLLRTFGV